MQKTKESKKISLYPFPKILFLICLTAITVFNLVVFSQEHRRILSYKKVIPFQNIIYKFAQLKKSLKGVEYVGYHTGTNLDDPKEAKLFAHAQYALAPTILDLNNTDHEYILFIYKNEQEALNKIQELNAMPLLANPKHNMILARRMQ